MPPVTHWHGVRRAQPANTWSSGNLPRATVQLAYEGQDKMKAFGRVTGAGDEHLRVGPVKIFVDGGFTGPAAYTKSPYKGQDEYRGELNMEPAELRKLISDAHDDGWQRIWKLLDRQLRTD